MFNFGTYRTGSFINPTQPDNDGDFETISVGGGDFAVDIGQMSFIDLRQVLVTGNVSVGRNSMLQIRGDPSAMHEVRRRTIRRNPRHLHIVRRVTRVQIGHGVLVGTS